MSGPLHPHRLLGVVAPMAVWALHFVVAYSLQGLACAQDWQRQMLWGREAVFWWLVAITLLALALIAWLGLRARRVWREDIAGGIEGRSERQRFTAAAATLLSAIAAVAVLFTATPILLLPPCL